VGVKQMALCVQSAWLVPLAKRKLRGKRYVVPMAATCAGSQGANRRKCVLLPAALSCGQTAQQSRSVVRLRLYWCGMIGDAANAWNIPIQSLVEV
jgi:hypothetical protein